MSSPGHIRTFITLIGVLLALLPISAQPAETEGQSYLFLGNDSLPPMSYNYRGEQIGIVVALADALTKHMKEDITVEFMDWSQAQALVLEDRADALLHINPNQQRRQIFDFSEPLLQSEFSIFTRTDRTDIFDISHLEGLRVGVEEKGLPSITLQTHPEIDIVGFADVWRGLQQVSRGEIDAFVVDKWVGAFLITEMGLDNIRITGYPVNSSYSRIAVKKGRPELLASINNALLDIQEDGTYAKILSQWDPQQVVFQTKAENRRQRQILLVTVCSFIIVFLTGIALAFEIRRRVKSESKLQESEELFKAVFAQAGGYCMILQPTDSGIPIILDANNAACESHGYTREELIGRPVAELDDEEGQRLCRERTRTILTEGTLSVENVHMRKDGSTFPVAVYANTVTFANREPLIVTTEFDISERHRAEAERLQLQKQLQQAQKMESIGTLAGGIAHDFNNILASVIGYTELALEDAEKGSQMEDNLQEVYIAGNRAKELVRQILSFARQTDEERKPIRVGALAEEVVKLIRSTIPATIQIEQEITSRAPVMADQTQLHQMFMNLFTNAAQAMEDQGGILGVHVADATLDEQSAPSADLPPGTYVKILVSDTGSGISPDVIESIFEPYFTTKEVGDGTGMGLAMVHGIVESCGGSITVESEIGDGTVFTILLPVFHTGERTPHKAPG